MVPLLILGGLVLAGMGSSSGRREDERDFDELFRPHSGDRLIAVDESRSAGGGIIRRFRTATDPVAWEIQVATTGDGLEQFAVTIHPQLTGQLWVSIRPARKQPIHLQRAYDEARGRDLAKDGYHANRYRYSHPVEGMVDWFVIRVTILGAPWLFECPSLYSEVVRARPALPAPQQPSNGVDGGRLSLVPLTDKVYQTSEKVDRVADELARLRTELPELIKTQRRYEENHDAVEDRLDQIIKSAAAAKRMKEKIDAVEGIDADQKEQLHETIALAFDQSIERFKRAIDIELN